MLETAIDKRMGFHRHTTINKYRYSVIKSLMEFCSDYKSFVRLFYNGKSGLRGLNNSYKFLKLLINHTNTTKTHEIFTRNEQHSNSSSSVQLSQQIIHQRGNEQCKIFENINEKELQEFRTSSGNQCSATVSANSTTSSSNNEARDNNSSPSLDEQCGVLIERSRLFEENISGRESIERVIESLEQSITRTNEAIERNKHKAESHSRESKRAANCAESHSRESKRAANCAESIDRKLAVMREEAHRKQISDSLARYASEVEMQFEMFIHCKGNMQRWINAGATLENIAILSEYVSTKLPEVRTRRERWVYNTISKWYMENKHNMKQALTIQPFVPFD